MNNAQMPSKTLILGIDGADWRVVQPLVDRGELPNLAKMMQSGVYGELTSTYPWNSVAAWATFQTGLNPGQHGLFDFYMSGMYDRKVISAKPLTGHSMWELLGRAGHRVGAINVPITYPPRAVNGFLIPGLLTPPDEETPTYPEGLLARFPNYVVEPRSLLMFNNVSERDYLQSLHASIVDRGRVAIELANEHPWDFLAVVFTETDRLHHFFWKVADPEHPDYDARVSAELLPIYEDCYRQIDRILGQLQNAGGDNLLSLVMSDHGFGPVSRGLDLSVWLEKHGYLTLKADAAKENKRALLQVAQKLDVFGVRRVLSPGRRGDIVRQLRIPEIDWAKTLVYPGTIAEQALYINTEGREANGIVSPGREYDALLARLTADLQAWYDEDAHTPIVGRVIPRDEVNRGAQTAFAPDLYLEPANRLDIFVNSLRDPHQSNLTPKKVYGMSGHHRMQGIYAAAGPCIARQGGGPRISIADLCPTVLYAMGAVIPAGLDGQARTEFFTPAFVEDAPAQFSTEEPEIILRSRSGANGEEDKRVVERLRSLGYL